MYLTGLPQQIEFLDINKPFADYGVKIKLKYDPKFMKVDTVCFL